MEPPGGRDSRFMGYSNNILHEQATEIYGNPNLGRPSTSIQQLSPRHTMVSGSCGGRALKAGDMCYDDRGMPTQGMGMDPCVNDMSEDTYNSLQSKKSPPNNGKKTKGRVKIKMEYIENKLRRYTTFSKRKTGIMKKAYELSTLTGTQVMLLVASETGHVYTFATRKLQPMITSEAGKALIQTCLNSPDPPAGSASGDQRMSATGFEETELTYNISDEESKDENMSPGDSSDSSDGEGPEMDIKEEPPVASQSKSNPSQSQATVTTSSSTTSSVPSTKSQQSSTAPTQASILPPLVYQTAQAIWRHTSKRAIEAVQELFPSKVISRRGNINWSPRSSDLSPVDYFLWCGLKSKVYEKNPPDILQLKENIATEVKLISREMYG